MRSKLQILGLFLVLLIILVPSCKKEEVLQPTWQWLLKEKVVLTETERSHKQNLDHIDHARTCVDIYVWGEDTLTLNGPAGYYPLTAKAVAEFQKAYENEVMPDTTQLSNDGMMADVIKDFLELRRDHSASQSFKKMRIAIPKDLYEVYPRFFERFLTEMMSYLTGQIGGNSEWYGGTRDLEREKDIRKLITQDDFDFLDPWECNCSAMIYLESFYKKYAEGDVKSTQIPKED
ncbi:MAG TPA: hypothetical protein VJ892_00105, partial [Candidatus Absconditabacterales bacterium]|nr:hypothetical protein [Candidatus Absconditabacterales bacterium]